MANHSATEKAIRKTAKVTAVNKNRRTRVRTYIKKVVTAVDSGVAREDATNVLVAAQSEMMRAVAKGLIKKNTASRKISRLAKKVKALAVGTGEKLVKVIKAEKAEKVAKVAKVEKSPKAAKAPKAEKDKKTVAKAKK
jgi:small subunit ribosomal protein S20